MRSRRGFTLLELLVVIAIIATLISVLVPAVSCARRKAMRAACATHLNEISRAMWSYSVSNDSRVPYVESPMTNGGLLPGFGDNSTPDEELNPYDRELWPLSLPNLLMPDYIGENRDIFVCPAALLGWPRNGGAYEMTYRDAAVNQPNGVITDDESYFRESFGFLDGRPMEEQRLRLTDDPIVNLQRVGSVRASYVRDLVLREGTKLIGPHDRGMNVITREFGVEFRNYKTMQDDLSPFGIGVRF